MVLLGLAALLALPHVPNLRAGIEHNQGKEELHQAALGYPEVVSLLLLHLSDGLLEIQRPFSTLLALALPLPLLIAGWRSRRGRQAHGAIWYLSLTGALQLLLLLGANEWLQVLEKNRVRYLATLWPPAVLLISLAMLHPKRALLRPPGGLVLVALMAFFGTSDYLGKGVLARAWSWRASRVSIAATRTIATERSTDGLLVVDMGLFESDRVYELYSGAYGKRRMRLKAYTTSDELLERAQDNDLVWMMSRSSQEQDMHLPSHIERFRQEGWFHCHSSREAGVTLELLLSPFPAAMLDQSRLQFENEIELFAPVAPELRDGLLRLRTTLSSADETILARYSLAIHVIDSLSDGRVAQADTGIGPGNYVPLCREIDVSALPPGDYALSVALYDWQTGARLIARDLDTDEVGDMHALHHFQHN